MPHGIPNKLIDVFKRVIWHQDPQKCAEFTGSKDTYGYGRIGFKNKTIQTHVAAFCASRGWLPEDLNGKCVLHTCDNPPCCNPNHLFLGTRADNHQDMTQKAGSLTHLFTEVKIVTLQN